MCLQDRREKQKIREWDDIDTTCGYATSGPIQHDVRSKLPLLYQYRSADRFIILVVSTAVFTDVFVYGLVVPVLPFALDSVVEPPVKDLQKWTAILLGIYGAANALASPFFGYLSDSGSTRQYSFLGGLLAMGGSLGMFWASHTLPLLVIARILQGISASGVWTVGLTLVVDTVDQDRIGSAMGYTSLALTLGNLLGPLFGGVVFDKFGYHAVFAMAIGLIGFDIVLRLVMIEKNTEPESCERGSWTDSSDRTSYGTFRAEQGQSGDLDSSTTSTPLNEETLSQHKRSDHDSAKSLLGELGPSKAPPAIALLLSRPFLVILLGIAASSGFYAAFDSILPIHVMRVFHWGSTGGGLIFLPLCLPSLFSPFIGRAVDKFGGRIVTLLSFGLSAPFYALLGFANRDELRSKILMCVLLVIIGASISAQTVPLMAQVSQVLDQKNSSRPGQSRQTAQAYALFNVAYATGTFGGAMLAGILHDSVGWMITTLILGLISAGVAVPIWFSAELKGVKGANPDPEPH